jgi:hypothetical protein
MPTLYRKGGKGLPPYRYRDVSSYSKRSSYSLDSHNTSTIAAHSTSSCSSLMM